MEVNLAAAAELIKRETHRYTGGPAHVFEKAGRDTFVALLREGLLPHHKLLDFGAGCLRLGYWFVRFLDSGNYYAIEPVASMMEAGKKHLFGPDIIRDKAPTFHVSANCDMTSFGVQFDYVVARSILTHTKPGMLHRILSEFAKCATPNGAMLASYWAAEGTKAYSVNGPIGDQMPRDEWGFIAVVKFSLRYLQSAASEYGLEVEEVMLETPRIGEQIWIRIAFPSRIRPIERPEWRANPPHENTSDGGSTAAVRSFWKRIWRPLRV